MKNTFKILSALVLVVSFAFIRPPKAGDKPITVVIDAGHGGKDHGAQFGGILEKDVVAQITQKIIKQNGNQNITIHLTRSDDKFMSLEDRIQMINDLKPDLVLSLHVNQMANREASGIEFYISPNNVAFEKSKTLALALDEKLQRNLNLKSRGIKEASFMVLKKSEFPAITLELGFLSNKNDRTLLTDDFEQERIAATIVEFIAEMK